EPDFPVAFFAPTRGAGTGDLLGGIQSQIFPGGREHDGALVVDGFAYEKIEKFGTFVPPMAKQFGIIRRKDQRRPLQHANQALDLLHALAQKMTGVFRGHFERGAAVINPLLSRPTRDGEIFDASKTARAGKRHVRLDVVEVEIMTDVAVEIAIASVAWIPFML